MAKNNFINKRFDPKLLAKLAKKLKKLKQQHELADDLYIIPDGTIYAWCLRHMKYETSGYLGSSNKKEDGK